MRMLVLCAQLVSPLVYCRGSSHLDVPGSLRGSGSMRSAVAARAGHPVLHAFMEATPSQPASARSTSQATLLQGPIKTFTRGTFLHAGGPAGTAR